LYLWRPCGSKIDSVFLGGLGVLAVQYWVLT
jgi:hypothetical protein